MHERFPRFLAEVFKKNSVDCLMFKNQRQVCLAVVCVDITLL